VEHSSLFKNSPKNDVSHSIFHSALESTFPWKGKEDKCKNPHAHKTRTNPWPDRRERKSYEL